MSATHEERVLAAVESGWDAAHRIQRDRAKLGEAAAELVGWINAVAIDRCGGGLVAVSEWEWERLRALADNVKEAYSS